MARFVYITSAPKVNHGSKTVGKKLYIEGANPGQSLAVVSFAPTRRLSAVIVIYLHTPKRVLGKGLSLLTL